MRSNVKLKLSGGIFCNSASKDESGAINCRRIFTSFLAWGYPTTVRTWHAIVTAHGFPKGTTSIAVSISYGRREKTTLTTSDIESPKPEIGNVMNVPLAYQFEKEGLYTVHFNVVGSTEALKVLLRVITQPWPKFTRQELRFLEKNPSIQHSIRANIICTDCSQPYVFEESVLPDEKLQLGVFPFPELGVFECDTCGHQLHLKDMQGQIRESIKKTVSAMMRKGK